MKKIFISLFHIIFVGGLFLYIGISNSSMPIWMYNLILLLGILILIFHLYKSYKKFIKGKHIWINLFHIFIISPLLIYLGLIKTKTPRFIYELIFMLGFAVIGYHNFYLLRKISNKI